MDDLLCTLGQRIRDLRRQKGWSQEEFADVCGVHRTYMGHLERGEKNLSFRATIRIATALGVALSELYAGIETGQPTESPGIPQGRPKTARRDAEHERARVLRELASVERSVRTLREIALGTDQDTPPRASQSKRSSRGSKS